MDVENALVWVRCEVARVLVADDIAVGCDDRNLFEMGMDSIGMVELASRLREESGLELPIDIFFRCSTMRELAQHVVRSHVDKP